MKHLFLLLPFFFFSIFANGQDSESPTQKDTTTLLADSIKIIPKLCRNTGNISFVCSRVDASVYYLDGVRIKEADCFVSVNLLSPLLSPIGSKKVYPREQLRILAARNISEVASLTAGMQLTTDGLSFRGSREDGTAYYLDGMRLLVDPIFMDLF